MTGTRRRRADPAWRERREIRTAALVDAALRAIRQHGPGVSMDQIAIEAGVAKPILYRHFGDRGGLVLAVAMRFMSELRAQLRAAFALPTVDARTVVVAAIDAHVALVERDPDVYRFIVERGNEAPGGTAKLQSFLQQVGAEVSVVLTDALKAAGHDTGVAETWAFGIVGMVHESSLRWSERRSISRARLVDALATLLWSGLGQAVAIPDGGLTAGDPIDGHPMTQDSTPQDPTAAAKPEDKPHGSSPSDEIIHALEATS